MAYLPRAVVERSNRIGLRPALELPPHHGRRLANLLRHFSRPPRDVDVVPHEVGGIVGELLVPRYVDPAIRLVYFHGGAYRIGSPATQRGLTARLVQAARVAAFSADYRLAPEHPCPAAGEDALSVWAAIPHNAPLVIGGDSAGAALALATAVAARDRSLPAPAGLALISPWVDLTMSGRSHAENARADPVLTPRGLRRAADSYRAGRAPDDPIVSPLNADLARLPPVLIHSGTSDLLLSDCEALAERVRAAGGEAELRLFEGMWHDFHVNVGLLREADEAIAEMGRWVRARLEPS